MSQSRPLVWLQGEIKTPPFSEAARIEAGVLLRQLQEGVLLSMPHSRPLPAIGPRVHELRVRDEGTSWRIVYRLDAVVVGEVFPKKTRTLPRAVIAACQRRFRLYDDTA